jgi:monoamine oxidase
MDQQSVTLSRRQLLTMIGKVAGAAVMYEAMSELALAGESGFTGPIELHGDPRGASVLVLGAGPGRFVSGL